MACMFVVFMALSVCLIVGEVFNALVCLVFKRTKPMNCYEFDKSAVPRNLRHVWRVVAGPSAGKYHYKCEACGEIDKRLSPDQRKSYCPMRQAGEAS